MCLFRLSVAEDAAMSWPGWWRWLNGNEGVSSEPAPLLHLERTRYSLVLHRNFYTCPAGTHLSDRDRASGLWRSLLRDEPGFLVRGVFPSTSSQGFFAWYRDADLRQHGLGSSVLPGNSFLRCRTSGDRWRRVKLAARVLFVEKCPASSKRGARPNPWCSPWELIIYFPVSRMEPL